MPAEDLLLPAIGHAISGAAGTAISTAAAYPLGLASTRLKVQRQLISSSSSSSSRGGGGGELPPPPGPGRYRGTADALARIYGEEGGLPALYAGLGPDVAKGVADSFLFFLFYAWFRARLRSRGGGGDSGGQLPAWEELLVGAAAGACARVFTTPIGNVVTRKQTASLMKTTAAASDGDSAQQQKAPSRDLSVGEILRAIRAEKGLLGLWAGYSATLVLTLNPSITFYLQDALGKALVGRRGREGGSGGGGATFLAAAVSKVVATALTYPFQIAKARSQVSAAPGSSTRPGPGEKEEASTSEGEIKALPQRLHSLAEETIFATVFRIGKTEGIPALYDGLSGELLKAFLSHGTTMLSKEVVHKLVIRLYFFILSLIRKSTAAQALLSRRLRGGLHNIGGVRFAETLSRLKDGNLVVNLLEQTKKLTVTR
ncbi:hypothetical protein VPNG_03328 [Cytospora leucostoma]|uniref:Peroxisomal adenine nucleotide transporter 1 n=1 Tax=Cytospora leucostoma TaxID=1230097 RepID=A0A423XFK8_9PEZI|nr:hypothetical protein VPNG_03328 [Cytospora leucostoma]